MLQEHQHDAPDASPLVQPPRQAVRTALVPYGRTAPGFMAEPASGEIKGSVVMIHEWWGLNDNVRGMAERLAGEGYRVLAVDLYDGVVAQAPEQAQQLYRGAMGDRSALRAHLTAAFNALQERPDAGRIGMMGWCMGGLGTLEGALALPEALAAAVIYYGDVSRRSIEELRPLRMPILGLFGEADRGIPADTVRAFGERLALAGVSADIHIYPGAGHAFANPSGRNYLAEPAADAWRRTLAFFETHLAESR